jgi:hypothetical protein
VGDEVGNTSVGHSRLLSASLHEFVEQPLPDLTRMKSWLPLTSS